MTFWSCRAVARMIARGDFDEARGPAKLLAWLHLLYCRHCRRYRRQMRLLAQAAGLWAGKLLDISRRGAFEDRLIERLSGGG